MFDRYLVTITTTSRITIRQPIAFAALASLFALTNVHAADQSRFPDPFERLHAPSVARPTVTPAPSSNNVPTSSDTATKKQEAPPARITEAPKSEPAAAPAKKVEEPASSSEPSIKISGRLQIDARRLRSEKTDGDKNTPYSSTLFDIRRARVDVKGNMTPSIRHKFSIELVDTVKVKDAFLELAWPSKDTRIRAGQFSYPFTNENLVSNRYYEFLEAASISDALSPSRDRGIALVGRQFDNRLFYNLSIVNGTGSKRPDKNEEFDYVINAEALPISMDDGNIKLWVGGSYATGKRNASAKEEVVVAPESQSGLTYFSMILPKETLYTRQRTAIDAKLVFSSFFVGAETLTTEYKFDKSAKITGGYAMASYFITGEQRNIEEGLIERQPVLNPVTSESGWGAWEIAVRYSWFEIGSDFFVKDSLFADWNKDNEVDPAKMAATGNAWTYAINWYPTKHTRLMFNWIESNAYTAEQDTSPSFLIAYENAMLLRGQIEF